MYLLWLQITLLHGLGNNSSLYLVFTAVTLKYRISVSGLYLALYLLTCFSAQPLGAQSSLACSLQDVSGVVFLTFTFCTEHFSTGHESHCSLVRNPSYQEQTYISNMLSVPLDLPSVTFSHFSSTTVSQLTTSSSTSCTFLLVSHTVSYTV